MQFGRPVAYPPKPSTIATARLTGTTNAAGSFRYPTQSRLIPPHPAFLQDQVSSHTVHGLNFGLLAVIAWLLLEIRHPGRRWLVAVALAVAGVTGAGALSEIGTVFYDDVLSLALYASILVVVVGWDRLADETSTKAATLVMVAGLPAGLAFGLKQPEIIYCLGLCGGFLCAEMALPRRIWLGACPGNVEGRRPSTLPAKGVRPSSPMDMAGLA